LACLSVEESLLHIHGPQVWRQSGYWKILLALGWQIQFGRRVVILSHVHGPLVLKLKKSGYWKIAQSLGQYF
jgi:hypothetical protein